MPYLNFLNVKPYPNPKPYLNPMPYLNFLNVKPYLNPKPYLNNALPKLSNR